ncbi:methyl-accepting chemotaxis protein [Veronia pacifica]|nr:methyl-accepting chemotaxis protein [Veronia pacifica]
MTEAAVISIEHQATRLEYIVIVATVISISFALFLSSRIISFLVKSLDKVFQSLAIMANGDFSVPCKVNLPGMLGNLQENTEKTRQSINKMLAGIADEVVESSGSLSEVSKEVQSIVDSQSREIMQVVTSTDELASSATQIAENANSTHDTTENVLSQANESLKLNDDVVKQIELLVDSLTQSSHALGKLEENSHNITTVLDVIKGIAEQTNLLALNAAIEAARAGDQGRGFAVVADEVRNLAKRTHDSTSEIETMISQFDGVTKDAVDTMQQSCELGDKTINIAKQSSDLLNTSNSSISKVNEMNLEVASAATQQSSVVEEMNVNVNRINEKAEASSEQVKALLHAVDQLCHVSDNLMKATGRAGT